MKNKKFEYKILVKTIEQYADCGEKEFGSSPIPKYCPRDCFRVKKYYKGFVACFTQPNSNNANEYFWGETKEEALRRLFKEVDWK